MNWRDCELAGRRRARRWHGRLTQGLVAVLCALHLAAPARAFKLKTHVYTANIAMADGVDGSVYLPGIVNYSMFHALMLESTPLNDLCTELDSDIGCKFARGHEIGLYNRLIQEALFLYPEMARGGAIGPDGFPDLLWGQQSAHVDHGRHDHGIEGGIPMHPGPVAPSTPDEVSEHGDEPWHEALQRDVLDPSTWRSVDYGIYLLQKAFAWNEDAPRSSLLYYKRLQAIAFP